MQIVLELDEDDLTHHSDAELAAAYLAIQLDPASYNPMIGERISSEATRRWLRSLAIGPPVVPAPRRHAPSVTAPAHGQPKMASEPGS